jgi:hypothetical protein
MERSLLRLQGALWSPNYFTFHLCIHVNRQTSSKQAGLVFGTPKDVQANRDTGGNAARRGVCMCSDCFFLLLSVLYIVSLHVSVHPLLSFYFFTKCLAIICRARLCSLYERKPLSKAAHDRPSVDVTAWAQQPSLRASMEGGRRSEGGRERGRWASGI